LETGVICGFVAIQLFDGNLLCVNIYIRFGPKAVVCLMPSAHVKLK